MFTGFTGGFFLQVVLAGIRHNTAVNRRTQIADRLAMRTGIMHRVYSRCNKQVEEFASVPGSSLVRFQPKAPSIVLLLRALFVVSSLGFSGAAFGQQCDQMTYEHRNQIDLKPIELAQIRGIGVDKDGYAVRRVCVGIFTESEHKLVRFSQGGDDGVFALDTTGLQDSNYRLVAQSPGFCPANAILRIRPHSHRKRKLLVHFEVSAVDHCSYISLARR